MWKYWGAFSAAVLAGAAKLSENPEKILVQPDKLIDRNFLRASKQEFRIEREITVEVINETQGELNLLK